MKWNIRELKARASALAEAHHPAVRRVVLLYCGVLAAMTLGSSGLSMYLDSRIGTTGGLDGMGLRSILQTVQEILLFANLYFGPFWSAGFLAAMIGLVRGRDPENRDLTEGFRRFGRILGHIACEWLISLGLAVAVGTLAGFLFAGAGDPTVPLLAAFALYAVWYGCLFYKFRLSLYLVMTQPVGAVQAHFLSAQLTQGHKWQLLRLDLSWWWYYVLLAAAVTVGDLNVLLSTLEISVPLDPAVMPLGTLAVYSVLYLGLSLWKKCDVDASYVLAYEAIAAPMETEAAE